MVSASAKRQAVKRVVKEGVCSERRACRYLGLHRSSCQYRAQEALEQTRKLVKRIVWLSRKYPRYGYRRIRALLLREGWKAGRKFVQRIRRLEGLGIKGRGPRQRRRGRSTASPTRAMRLNEVWSWDFVHDRTDNGVPLKMLTLIDEYSRQCLRIEVGRKLKSKDVLDVLAGAMAERGVPHHIRSDNGPEFIARDVQDWLEEMGICTIYIEPRQSVAERTRGTERSEIDRSRRRRAPKECDRRRASKLPQPAPGRMPQPGGVPQRDRGPGGDRGMEELLQPRPPAQQIGLPKPRRLCQNHGATRTSPRNLTFQLAQKGCPDQAGME